MGPALKQELTQFSVRPAVLNVLLERLEHVPVDMNQVEEIRVALNALKEPPQTAKKPPLAQSKKQTSTKSSPRSVAPSTASSSSAPIQASVVPVIRVSFFFSIK